MPASDKHINDRQPDEIGLEKIFLFPEKLASLNHNRENLDLSYPISVELSLTNHCNLNCIWCSDLHLRSQCPDRLTPELLASLFKDLSKGGTRGITIEGGGEPTLSPFFEKVIHQAIDCGLSVGLITNGLDLFAHNRPPELYSLFQWIRVSLDASNPEQYKKLKGQDGYNQVLSNLTRLIALKPTPTLGAGYVLTNLNDNPEGLSHLATVIKDLGLSYLHLRPVVDHPGLVSQLATDFLKQYESPSFSVNLGAMTDNSRFGNAGLPCLAHSLSAVITADGSLWLCGRLNADPKTGSLGQLSDDSFKTLWQSEKRRFQTTRAAQGDFCLTHCPQCRMTKYNLLMDNLAKIKTRDFI